MRLNEILAALGCKSHDTQSVTQVAYDTRHLSTGDLMILTGTKISDDMVRHLKQRPPCAIIAHQDVIPCLEKIQPRIPVYPSPDPHQALGVVAGLFFPTMPPHKMAVTGTNGKSSVVHFVRSLGQLLGYPSASIGTLGVCTHDGQEISGASTLTMPNAWDMRKWLHTLAQQGITHVALEASSHGLHQARLLNIPLQAAAFTQLTQDHLDYHHTMEAYFEAKLLLFSRYLEHGQTAVLNRDDPYFDRLYQTCRSRGHKTLQYGYHAEANLRCLNLKWDGNAYHADFCWLGHTFHTTLHVMGSFQILNIMCAVGLLLGSGVDLQALIPLLPHVRAPEGRLSYAGQAPGHGHVYIDYAHAPDSLKHALEALRPLTLGALRVVFGCGGDRDTTKRPLMGQIASRLSDVAYVTDDNPRTEDPASIRAQVLEGCVTGIEITQGRQEAIHRAILESQDQDRILIAGKGHESVQWIGNQALPFSDRLVAEEIIERLKKEAAHA